MLASVNQPTSTKDSLRLLTPLLLGMLAALSFLWPARPDKNALVAEMNACLREEKFERLYEKAGGNVRLNVSKEKFVRRMRAAAATLKAIDGGLDFRRDAAMENMFSQDESVLLTAVQKLEGNGKSVSLRLNWTPEGKFFDLSVTPEVGTPNEFNVYGVSHQSITVKGRVVED